MVKAGEIQLSFNRLPKAPLQSTYGDLRVEEDLVKQDAVPRGWGEGAAGGITGASIPLFDDSREQQ